MPPMRIEPIESVYEFLNEEDWQQTGEHTFVSPDGSVAVSVGAIDEITNAVPVERLLRNWRTAGAETLASRFISWINRTRDR